MSGPLGHAAATVAFEAARYLEAIDLFRSLGLDVTWRCEAEELREARSAERLCGSTCGRWTGPRTRITRRHVGLGVR